VKLKDYSTIGKRKYGEKCEWKNCGWDDATCDVHHINYEYQQKLENRIREAYKSNKTNIYIELIQIAHDSGFRDFDKKKLQLAKCDMTHNLAVLCPNHHRYVHEHKISMDILKYIPKRS
jgi:hypothetical protein